MLTSVTLSYRGISYTFQDEQSRVMGRLGCDCQKSRLIREMSDPEFSLLSCGAEIALVSVLEEIPPPPGQGADTGAQPRPRS